ncbi:MAG TPA: hypothetical protein VJ652_08340 [Noviherbaspirillum sp.]|nr:hypothetical protein [Noviherbaspirillum sp.]
MDKENSRARLYYLFGAKPGSLRMSWPARVPPGLFAVPVGLFGLVGAWRRAATHGWPLAADIERLLLWPVSAIWITTLLLYLYKCVRYPQAVLREFHHPVQSSLQALLPLSMLLAVIILARPGQGIWLLMTLVALALHAFIGYRVIAMLATGRLPENAVTPALYLPIVGGALVGAMALATLKYSGWSALLFGTGLSGWALLEARILSRLFDGPMPEALRPTIGVELAPPAIATLTAAVVWPELPGNVLAVGLGVAVSPFIGVLARYQWWSKVPFSIGFWSFSFPLAALASAVIETVYRGGWPPEAGIAALLLASAVIAFLMLRTVALLLQGRLLPAE